MKKTNLLFNIFLSITLFLSVIALIFASLSLSLAYSETIANIKVNSPFSIIFIIFLSLSVLLPVVQAFVIKDYKITRAKENTIALKIASVLVICALAVLSVYDFTMATKSLFDSAFPFEAWKFLRIIMAILFSISMILKSFLSKARIPSAIRHALSISPVAWTLFSVLAIYFSKSAAPVPEVFKILFSLLYIFGALFFLYDFKWISLTSNTKFYIAITTIFTSFTFIVSLSSLIGLMFGGLSSDHTIINAVEMATAFMLGVFGLAKILSIKRAIRVTAKQEVEKSEHSPEENKKNQSKK